MSKKRKKRRQKFSERSVKAMSRLAGGELVKTTRKGALVRIIDTAIWLWFLDKDPFAIHLLACSAYNCLCDLGEKAELGPLLQKKLPRFQMTAVYDFLRHASPNQLSDSVELPPVVNQWILFYAAHSFAHLFGGLTALMCAFGSYFSLFLTPEDSKSRKVAEAFLPDGVVVDELIELSKIEFLNKVTQMFIVEIKRDRAK